MSKARDGVEDLKTIDANLAAKAPLASPVFTGNVGIGVTPESWTVFKVLQLGGESVIRANTDHNEDFAVGRNMYYDGSWKRINSAHAQEYLQDNSGNHLFRVAASGAADSAISWNTAMTIDNAGVVTKPLQPAFSACLSTSHTFAVGTTTIVFDSEIFDQNSDFNAPSATFTAPVTGKYQFNISIRIDNMDQGASYYRLMLKTSNGDYQPIIIGAGSVFNSDLSYFPFTMPVLADMDAGDTAYVQFQVNGGAAQAQIHASRPNANFSGYLVA